MSATRVLTLLAAVLALAAGLTSQSPRTDEAHQAITRGVAFLSAEVPRWHPDHGCYSCHHNGDAARALLVAAKRGYDVGAALDDTLEFLRAPGAWEQNKDEGGVRDRALARIQFAGALAVAARFDRAPESAIKAAANLLVANQSADGSWALDAPQNGVTAATYGPILATWTARTALVAAGREPDDMAVVATDRWFRGATADNVLDAAAVVLGLDVSEDLMAERLRANCLRLLRERQTVGGGWASSPDAEPQVFESALAVLALGALDAEPGLARKVFRPEELRDAISRGRAFLISQQRPDGGWPEARPAGGKPSHAQQVSTTSWALLALLGMGAR